MKTYHISNVLIKSYDYFQFLQWFYPRKKPNISHKLSTTKFIFDTEKISKIQISAAKNQQGKEEGRVILTVASKSLKIAYIVV